MVCHTWQQIIRSSAFLWQRHLSTILTVETNFNSCLFLKLLERWKRKEPTKEYDLDEKNDSYGDQAPDHLDDYSRDGTISKGGSKDNNAREILIPSEAVIVDGAYNSAANVNETESARRVKKKVSGGVASEEAGAIDANFIADIDLGKNVDDDLELQNSRPPQVTSPIEYDAANDEYDATDDEYDAANDSLSSEYDPVERKRREEKMRLKIDEDVWAEVASVASASVASVASTSTLNDEYDATEDEYDDADDNAGEGIDDPGAVVQPQLPEAEKDDDDDASVDSSLLSRTSRHTDSDDGIWYTSTHHLPREVVDALCYWDLEDYYRSTRQRLLQAAATNPRLLRQLVVTMRRMRSRKVMTKNMIARLPSQTNTIRKDYETDRMRFLRAATVDVDQRILAFVPEDSNKIFVLDVDYLKVISIIDVDGLQPDEFNLLPCGRRLSFRRDYLYVCVNGVIDVYEWKVMRKVKTLTPTLDVSGRVYPVRDDAYLGCLDMELVYIFDAIIPADPVIKYVFVAEDEFSSIRFSWKSLHIVDSLVLGLRSSLTDQEIATSGHSMHIWSLLNGDLLRQITFKFDDFPISDPELFLGAEIRFIGNSALLVSSRFSILCSYPIKEELLWTDYDTLKPEWTPWRSITYCILYARGDCNHLAFLEKHKERGRRGCFGEYQIWDFRLDPRPIAEVKTSDDTALPIFFNGFKMVLLYSETYGSAIEVLDFLNLSEWDTGKFCFRCQKIGHTAKRCVEGLRCYLCHADGHKAKDCDSKVQNSICFHCREKGHLAKTCENPKKRVPYVKLNRCRICRGYCHEPLDCKSWFTGLHRPQCYKCCGYGHVADKCTSKKYWGRNGRMVSCFICWRKGHVRRNCPENKRNQNEARENDAIRQNFAELPNLASIWG